MTSPESNLLAALIAEPSRLDEFDHLVGHCFQALRPAECDIDPVGDLSEREVGELADDIIRDLADGKAVDRTGQFDLQSLRESNPFWAVLHCLKKLRDQHFVQSSVHVGDDHEFRSGIRRMHGLVLLFASCFTVRELSASTIGTVVNIPKMTDAMS